MLASRWAVADNRANCARIAENFANTNVKDVNLWLARYRGTYARCLTDIDVTNEPSSAAKKLIGSEPEAGNEKTAIKSPNTKAVFKSTATKQAVKPIQKSLDISKIEKPPSAPNNKPKKPAGSKNTQKTRLVTVKASMNLPIPASTQVQKKKNPVRNVGSEGWRINCSARFGGWDKSSEWYISSTGKRVSCTIRP